MGYNIPEKYKARFDERFSVCRMAYFMNRLTMLVVAFWVH